MNIALTALLVLCSALPAFAQDQQGWIDVNFGAATAAERSYGVAMEDIRFFETARFEAAYEWTRGANFDFGGGYMFTPLVGAGLSFSGTAHRNPAVVSARIPHPLRFDTHAAATARTNGELQKAEGAAHIQVVLQPLHTDTARIRIFGGPSYFRVEQDTIDAIAYLQEYTLLTHSITITSAPLAQSEGTAWGFHIGGDVAYFFSRVFGLGGFARFSRATVDLPDFSGVVQTKAGGFQTGGGVRLRF